MMQLVGQTWSQMDCKTDQSNTKKWCAVCQPMWGLPYAVVGKVAAVFFASVEGVFSSPGYRVLGIEQCYIHCTFAQVYSPIAYNSPSSTRDPELVDHQRRYGWRSADLWWYRLGQCTHVPCSIVWCIVKQLASLLCSLSRHHHQLFPPSLARPPVAKRTRTNR